MRQIARAYVNSANERANDIDAIRSRNFVEEKHRRAWDHLQFLKRYFAADPSIKYRRCLGWGGNGLAAAFDCLDEDGNPTDPVVVKMIFSRSRATLRRETNMCVSYPNPFLLIYICYIR